MSNSEMSIQSETPVGYDHALLRYVVPFFFDKQERGKYNNHAEIHYLTTRQNKGLRKTV